MRVYYCTDGVPAAERFDYYREMAALSPVPVEIRGDRRSVVDARLEGLDLGAVSLAVLTAREDTPTEIHRTPALIRRADPGAYRLLLSLRGSSQFLHQDRYAMLTPGQMGFYDVSRPFQGWRQATGGCRLLMLTFPHALLPLPPRAVREVIGARLSGHRGVGALVVQHLTRLSADFEQYTEADRGRLAGVALELVTTLLAHRLDTVPGAAEDPEARRRALLLRIQDFVRRRLDDPGLTPHAVAAAHHLSLRTLQKLFQEENTTVTGWIRAARLARCRADLADPCLRDQPVHRLAARWGFPDAAHFSRTFRAAYGMSPGQWREQSRRAASTDGAAPARG